MAPKGVLLILLVRIVSGPRVADQWTQLERDFRRWVDGGHRRLRPLLATVGSNVSKNCSRDADRLLTGIKNLDSWAFTMMDASAKPVDGLISGTLTSLGSYDQCVDLRIPASDISHPSFTGQYCTLKARPPLPPRPKKYRLDQPLDIFSNISSNNTFLSASSQLAQVFYYLSFRYGICVPSTCSRQDVERMAGRECVVLPAGEFLRLNISVPSCETKQPFILQNYQILPTIGIGLLLSMNIIGTTVSIYRARKKLDNSHHGPAIGFLNDFNMIENGKRILETSRSIGSLDILHGMKFLTLTWIILGHTYCNTDFQLVRSALLLPKFPDSFAFTALMNGTLSVDSFFFISGLLVTYTVLKKSKGIKTINIPLMVFHRFWRIIPGMMVCVCLLCFLPWMGSGPLWHELIDPEVKGCRRHWWTNMLFINNFVAQDQPCLEHTWFLACDFQFYLLSLPVLILLLRWPTVGLTLDFILIVLSMTVTGYLTYTNDYTPTILMIYSDPEFRKEFNRNLYFKPYPHAGPYFVGLAVGYLIEKYPAFRPTKIVRALGWMTAVGLSCSSLYGVYDWNRGHLPDTWVTVLYASTHRTAWALALAWMTLICCAGNGGLVTRLLSWKVFVPLSRCTYMAFLIHIYVQMHYLARARVMIYADHQVYIWQFFGNLVVSFFLAWVATVLFEAPSRSLEKHLSRVSIKRKSSSFTLPRWETKWPDPGEKEMSPG